MALAGSSIFHTIKVLASLLILMLVVPLGSATVEENVGLSSNETEALSQQQRF
jgi:hypothetical protein